MLEKGKGPSERGQEDALRPLNVPEAVEVREDGDGRPSAVKTGRAGSAGSQWQAVTEITDLWRIDDEWWREEPISRMYYRVSLEDGTAVTVFRDLSVGVWRRQRA